MKKVLVFHHCGRLGGGLLSCFDLIDMLSDEYEVYLAITNPDEQVLKIMNNLKIKEQFSMSAFPSLTYHNADHNSLKTMMKYFLSKKHTQDWIAVAEKVQPDVVILNSSAIIPLAEPLEKAGFKTVCFVRETMYPGKNLPVNRLLRNMLSKASAVAYLTEFDMTQWSVIGGRQFVAPDVVNERFYRTDNKPLKKSEEFTILYMGGMVLEKGIELLVEAYELLSATEKTKLVILGGDVYESKKSGLINKILYSDILKRFENIKSRIKNLNQPNKKIECIGIVSDTVPYYLNSDVVVFPVLEIHQPRPAYEAGYFKKPIILPDCPNFKENVKDGYNGLYYEQRNAQALADKLSILISNRCLTAEMGENNNKNTQEKHSTGVVAQTIKRELQVIIEG